jgi:4-amino-4-deoxy-L-arabinose transferase-like glycosyltransferase
MPPLYPLLIALFKSIFSEYGVGILHTVLFGATYYLFTLLLKEIVMILGLSKLLEQNKTQWIILLAPLTFFLYPPIAYGYLNVSVFSVSTFLFISFIYLIALIHNSRKTKYFLFLGFVAGFLTLARSEFYYVGFGILLVYLILQFRRVSIFFLKSIFIYVLGLIIVVGPWLIRNKLALGEPVLSTAKYYNLWRGNNLAQTTIPITPEAYYSHINFYTQFTELEQEQFLKVEFEKYVKENKSHFFVGILKKMRNFFFSYYPKSGPNYKGDFYHGNLLHYLFIPWCIILFISFFFLIKDKVVRNHPYFLTLLASYFVYMCIHGLTQVLPRYNLQYLMIFIVINFAVFMHYQAKKISNNKL